MKVLRQFSAGKGVTMVEMAPSSRIIRQYQAIISNAFAMKMYFEESKCILEVQSGHILNNAMKHSNLREQSARVHSSYARSVGMYVS